MKKAHQTGVWVILHFQIIRGGLFCEKGSVSGSKWGLRVGYDLTVSGR
jgi:hypothetical protein